MPKMRLASFTFFCHPASKNANRARARVDILQHLAATCVATATMAAATAAAAMAAWKRAMELAAITRVYARARRRGRVSADALRLTATQQRRRRRRRGENEHLVERRCCRRRWKMDDYERARLYARFSRFNATRRGRRLWRVYARAVYYAMAEAAAANRLALR